MTGFIRFSPLAARSHGASPFTTRSLAASPLACVPADFDRAIDSIAAQLFNGSQNTDLALRANVSETDSNYVLRFDVPGVSKDNINITVEDKLVKIEVNFAAAEVEGEKTLRAERVTGSATRNFRLPHAVDTEAASATHDLGVLTLTLPKKTLATQKRVAIN